MPRAYTIRPGCAFRLADGSVATGGQTITLDDDVALAHADKLEHDDGPASAAAPAPDELTEGGDSGQG